jgi:hypothetical protein
MFGQRHHQSTGSKMAVDMMMKCLVSATADRTVSKEKHDVHHKDPENGRLHAAVLWPLALPHAQVVTTSMWEISFSAVWMRKAPPAAR